MQQLAEDFLDACSSVAREPALNGPLALGLTNVLKLPGRQFGPGVRLTATCRRGVLMAHMVLCFFIGTHSLSFAYDGAPENEVDPLIGTANSGQTLPAVSLPFAMTQWTPQTRDGEAKCVAPYYHSDSKIQGFRGTHWWSGSCTQDYGSVTLMALRGPLRVSPEARASRFSHSTEKATPWVYSVRLDDYQIEAKLTGTTRAGIFRFSFLEGMDAHILVQPNSRPGEGSVEVFPERSEIVGINPVHRIYQGSGKLAGFSGYFVAKFDKPIISYGVWEGEEIRVIQPKQDGRKGQPGAFVRFRVTAGENIQVKIGTSFTSIEQARKNLEAEIPDWDFQRVSDRTKKIWHDSLSRVEVKGGTSDERRILYTALYHALLMPRLFSDVSGTYPEFAGGRNIQVARGYNYYDDFSLWDTFRGEHPLLIILEPARTNDMVRSLLDKAKQGGWLPIFPGWNSYTGEMIGDHAIAMIVDAYLKGIRGFDAEEAYQVMRKNAMDVNKNYVAYVDGKGRRALASYLKFGFVPVEDKVTDAFHKEEQSSRTLEYAYDDFVLAQMARALSKWGDYQVLMKRAENYENVFDASVGFIRGKHADGSWVEPFDPTKPQKYITEGTPWQYTFFVPQDVRGLANLLGGREAMAEKLDFLFSHNLSDHGNEPSHHIPYLYDFLGKPWKTQAQVRAVMEKEYGLGPSGLSGNDDCGQMSAWYVFSAMGMYPACPGRPSYEIGTPLFPEVIIHLASGKRFVIRANGVSRENKYIESANLNGKSYDKPWITHKDIVRGGTLVFEMGSKPNKSWGCREKDAPPSMTGWRAQ